MQTLTILLVSTCLLAAASARTHFYFTTLKTWKDAQDYCRTYYTDLSTIKSQEEEDQLLQIAEDKTSLKWIGLYRNESNVNQFLWSDGTLFDYTSWEPGQPNNVNGLQHCVVIQFQWNDYYCDMLNAFFCQKNTFILVKEQKTWEEALRYCRTHYNDLTTLETDTKLQLAKDEVMGFQIDVVWTGLRFQLGHWFWVSNADLKSQTSLPGCPVYPYRCGARNMRADTWENRDCEEKLSFLCD